MTPVFAVGPIGEGDWRQRLAFIVHTMRDVSRQTDPEEMVRLYSGRMRQVVPSDRLVTLSRRDLTPPLYRITRSSTWTERINPWKEPERLPQFDRGLLGQLLYADEPAIVDDICIAPDDPAAEYLAGQRSLIALPLFDRGTALNMVVLMRREPGAFDREQLPEQVWMSNLFGQATSNLVLSEDLRAAYDAVDRELRAVAEIQRSLLPARLPLINGLRLAAHYQTSRRAGGDYYDFFALPGGRWGILVADVSGHGTPAAVLMAITHSIAHTCCNPPAPPGRLLAALNDRLASVYTAENGQFVTAAYAVYDPATRQITYASAGHPAPRVRRPDGRVEALDGKAAIPLGIDSHISFPEHQRTLAEGDTLIFFTDGITEARDPSGELFELHGLDRAIRESDGTPESVIRNALVAVDRFTRGAPAADDRTLLVAQLAAVN
jgi:sigma-B regulation protein RsbU (phosphoserine phosphatase)